MHSKRRRRRLRSHKLAATLIVLAIIAGVSGATDLGYISLKSRADQLQASLTLQLQAGQRDLEAGKASLQEANSKHQATLITQAIYQFVRAKGEFLAASQLADDSRLLHYLEQVPAIGEFARSRHTAVNGIARMGAALADAGTHVSMLDAEIITPPPSGEAGRTLLTVLAEVDAGLAKVRTDVESAQTAAAQVDAHVLPVAQQVTFSKARDSIESALAGFAEFERLVPVLTDVLGGNGVRTYLVEQVNPAELRAGGGFIGTYSLLQTNQGSVKVVRSGDAYDLANPRPLPGQPGFIPQPTPYREIIPTVSWSFVDSNIYPDFASNALAAEQFIQPRVGTIDGVISIDYYVVARMLDFTGPLDVPGYGLKVDSNTFISQSMRHDIASDASHKAILSALAEPLLKLITSLPPDKWSSILGAFNALAAGRHLQAFFNKQGVEAELDRIAWSGRLNTEHTDFMMEVESNYYGNKTNYFVTRHYSVDLVRVDGALRHQVSIDFVNNEPCALEDRTLYRTDVRLYVSGNVVSGSDNLRAVVFANPPAPANTKLLDGWLLVSCGGGHGQAMFTYDTPWPADRRAGPQIYWQKQPGTISDTFEVAWTIGSTTYRASGDLGEDRVVNLSRNGIFISSAHPSQATLPSLSLG